MTESKRPLTWWKEGEKRKYCDEKGRVRVAQDEYWTENGEMFHLCPDGQVYTWTPRKQNPLSCPRCRYRFDSPYRKR